MKFLQILTLIGLFSATPASGAIDAFEFFDIDGEAAVGHDAPVNQELDCLAVQLLACTIIGLANSKTAGMSSLAVHEKINNLCNRLNSVFDIIRQCFASDMPRAQLEEYQVDLLLCKQAIELFAEKHERIMDSECRYVHKALRVVFSSEDFNLFRRLEDDEVVGSVIQELGIPAIIERMQCMRKCVEKRFADVIRRLYIAKERTRASRPACPPRVPRRMELLAQTSYDAEGLPDELMTAVRDCVASDDLSASICSVGSGRPSPAITPTITPTICDD